VHQRFDLLGLVLQGIEQWVAGNVQWACCDSVMYEPTLEFCLAHKQFAALSALFAIAVPSLKTVPKDRELLAWLRDCDLLRDRIRINRNCACKRVSKPYITYALTEIVHSQDYELATWMLENGFQFEKDALDFSRLTMNCVLWASAQLRLAPFKHDIALAALRCGQEGLAWAAASCQMNGFTLTEVVRSLRKTPHQTHKAKQDALVDLVHRGFTFQRIDILAAIARLGREEKESWFRALAPLSSGSWDGFLVAAKKDHLVSQWAINSGCPLDCYCDQQHCKRIKI
jgi:hypothetical protein